MNQYPTSDSSFQEYRAFFENSISSHISLLGEKSDLRHICQYALSTGGKRLRPIITLMVANAIGRGADVTYAALGIEFFHTASLVVDDLPSMDDDDERRHFPSVHKKFGESAALLVSYALIASGYECLAKNTEVLRGVIPDIDHRCVLALQNASENTGLNGATGGQYFDINPPDLSLSSLKKILHMKTTTLYEIAFMYGWLFGGGDLERLNDVKAAASHFGLAFQIADDLGDMEQDLKNGRKVNFANLFGKEEAEKMFHGEHEAFLLKIKDLGLGVSQFGELLRC